LTVGVVRARDSGAGLIGATVTDQQHPNATAINIAEMLSAAKALSVSLANPEPLVIGSDQVAEVDGERLDKPGEHARAVQQLTLLSGRSAMFHTAVALLNTQTGAIRKQLVPTRVYFRSLNSRQIEAYLRRERPYDCAGSAKSEGLGIALIRSIEGSDPTALIGLPLIALTDMLAAEGINIV